MKRSRMTWRNERDRYLEIMALGTTEEMQNAATAWMKEEDEDMDETTLFQKWGFSLGLIVHSADHLQQFVAQVKERMSQRHWTDEGIVTANTIRRNAEYSMEKRRDSRSSRRIQQEWRDKMGADIHGMDDAIPDYEGAE